MKITSGSLVVYTAKNEIGLVKRVTNKGAFVWYHMGGTASMTTFDIMEPISTFEALKRTFSNEYAKASLFERRIRLNDENGDVDDLIDERHIRESVNKIISRHSMLKLDVKK